MGNNHTIKHLLKTSIPSIYGVLVAILMSVIDGVYLSRYDINAFNGLILILPFIGIISGVGGALSAASSDIIASTINPKERKSNFIISFFLSIILGLVVSLISHFAIANILTIINVTDLQINNAITTYWQWILPSFFLQVVFIVIIQNLITFKLLAVSNIIITIVTLINLILNPILIFHYNLGIKGAAISTNISFLVGLTLTISYLIKSKKTDITPLKPTLISIYKNSIISMSIKSFLVFITIGVYLVSSILFNKLALKYSTEELMIWGIINQITSLAVLPTRGVLGAYIISFSELLAVKSTEKYWLVFKNTAIIILYFTLPFVIVSVFFPNLISLVFNFTNEKFSSTLAYFLIMNTIFIISIIIPRVAQMGFLSVNKSHFLFIQSLCIVVVSYLAALFLESEFGFKSLILGQLFGGLLVNIFFFFLFKKLINSRISLEEN